MLFFLNLFNLIILGTLGAAALFWLFNSARALSKTWSRSKRSSMHKHLLARYKEVRVLMFALLVLTGALTALQVVRHFPDLAFIHERTSEQRAAGLRDYNLVRRQLDERPWYHEAITGKGSILDRNCVPGSSDPVVQARNDSMSFARYHFDEQDSLFQRYYPLGEAAIHVIGYSTRVRGKAGLESAFSDYLLGEEALSDRIINSLFRVQKEGRSLQLTMDYRLQETLYNTLKQSLDRQRTTRGSACMMDPNTGEVLALASLPSYSLDVVTNYRAWQILNNEVVPLGEDSVVIVHRRRDATLDTLSTYALADYPETTPIGHAIKYSSDRPLVFRAVRGTYPPGSTFKTVMACAMFELGMDFRYHSAGTGYTPHGYRRPIRSHGRPIDRGELEIFKAMEISDNEYFAALADSLGAEVVGDYARRLGVMGPLSWNTEDNRLNDFASMHIREIPYEPRERYDVALSGIGQGPLITNPLRMAVSTSVIASGGYRCEPILERGRVPRRERVISEATCVQVTRAMMQVVTGEEGTARSVFIEDLPVAAKTGTAQAPGINARDHSWFVCFAPADDPKIVVCVMGENAGWGSVVGLRTAKTMLLTARDLGYFADYTPRSDIELEPVEEEE